MTIDETISELRSLCAPHISREPNGDILAHCISLGIGPGKLTLLLDEIERLKAELEAKSLYRACNAKTLELRGGVSLHVDPATGEAVFVCTASAEIEELQKQLREGMERNSQYGAALSVGAELATEVVSLRARNAELEKADGEWFAASMDYVEKLAAAHARNAELEAFAGRMRGAPGRIRAELQRRSDEGGEYWMGEGDDAEEMNQAEMIEEVADWFRSGSMKATIYGPGPLPWDEKGGR